MKMSLNFNIGSAATPASLNIDVSTDSDVVTSLANNTPFPDREIQLGRIQASFNVPSLTLSPGAGASVSVSASSSFNSGVAIYQTSTPVLQALPLDPSISLDFQEGNNDRFLLLSFGYTASGSINGTVPIGLLGSATFGVSGQADAALAVICRFDKGAGADDVFKAAADSLKLPSQVKAAGDLSPGAWLVAEVDGTVALNLGASLGYQLAYSKELQLMGVSHDLGVKIDAAITATLGFTASGKYLVVLSRPLADQTLRLQLMKQRKNGFSLGLALTAGITADPPLPANLNDFVASVFGTHGQQIVNDLHAIENWTSGDLGSNLAALTTRTAKDLLRDVTTVDPDAALAQATGILKDALASWDKLVQNGSTEVQSLVWDLLGNPDANARNAVTTLLNGLTVTDPKTFAQNLSDALQNLKNRQWLLGIADVVGSASGLALGQQASQVQKYAGDVLSVLNGSIFTQLQKTIDQQFKLSNILAATDPAKLTQWVQDRLAAFLDKTVLSQTDLGQIQQAIQTLDTKIGDLYAKTKSAINTRYSVDFSLQYELNTADTALLDVEFDLSQAPAAQLFQNVMGNGAAGVPSGAAAIFAGNAPVQGVMINEALLTHEIHSSATTHFALPFMTSDTAHLNDTVASLAVEQNGMHLVASVKSKDQVTTGRFASILSLAETLTIQGSQVTPDPDGQIAYEMRLIRPAMPQIELVNGTQDFVNTYLNDKFPSPAAYTDQFLKDLDITISNILPNPTNNFGDMAVSMQVALTTDLLGAWIVARDAPGLLAAQVTASLQIQTLLRKFTALSYLQDLKNLANLNAVAPLLVWCALPAVAGADFDANAGTLTTNTGKDTYWDFQDPNLAQAMVNLTATEKKLEAILSGVHQRLLAAGDNHNASFYGPDFTSAAGSLRGTVLHAGPQGQIMTQFQSLLFVEASVIGNRAATLSPASGIAKALDVGSQLANSGDPNARQNIARELATFGETLTSNMNSGLSNIYTRQNSMTYGPMLLVEVSRALQPQSTGPARSAMIQLLSLKQPHKFDLNTFLAGSYPDGDDIAVAQTLVSLA
jgi:hypothetical protein